MKKLTAMEQKFVLHYLRCGNATEAARMAGYAYPNKASDQIRKRPHIQAAMAEEMKGIAMSAEEVLHRLSQHARGNMLDFVHFPDDADMEPEVSLHKARDEGQMHLVKDYVHEEVISTREDGKETRTIRHKIKLYDAQSALVHLGRYHSLFKDISKQEVSGEIEISYTNDWRGDKNKAD